MREAEFGAAAACCAIGFVGRSRVLEAVLALGAGGGSVCAKAVEQQTASAADTNNEKRTIGRSTKQKELLENQHTRRTRSQAAASCRSLVKRA